MATGIVSNAAWVAGFRPVAWALFVVNVVAYTVVSTVTAARVSRNVRSSLRDLTDYSRAVGSFTAIAGTCVFGTQFVVLNVSTVVATALFVLGASLWIVLIYGIFTGLTVRNVEEPIEEALDGSWLLTVVATQSVAVFAGLLVPSYPSFARKLLFVSLLMFSVGGLFYLIPLIFYRLLFFPVDPESLSSPYWINAGAVAITTLAGSTLVAASGRWGFILEHRQFLVGFTFFFWVAATWWIPLLFSLGTWRHTIGGIQLPYTDDGYQPADWAIVFPMGMYTVSTHRLVTVTSIDLVSIVPHLFVYVALGSWVVVGVGLFHRFSARFSEHPR